MKKDSKMTYDSVLGIVPKRTKEIMKRLKKENPDYKFTWHKTQKWAANYETVHSLNRDLGIPKSTIYAAIKKLTALNLEGFSFSQRVLHYEWQLE